MTRGGGPLEPFGVGANVALDTMVHFIGEARRSFAVQRLTPSCLAWAGDLQGAYADTVRV